MTDPRDLAQQWLAQVIDDRMDRLISPATGSALARAILDQPGVTVDASTTLYASSGRREVSVVIQLPAQPVTEEQR